MANSAVVGILRALLHAEIAQFEQGMKRAADSAKVFARETKTIGQQATTLGTQLSKTLTIPIVTGFGSVAKAAIDFESSFAGVRKTVDGTEAEFKAIATGFRELAKTIPVNVNELNRLGEAAGALGIPKEEIVDFARVMAELGVTTNVTSDQAAQSIAEIQTIFRSAGKETENFASTLVDLGNKGASTEAQILELANRLASAGRAIGLTQDEVLAFSSAMANVGINAEAGGTAMSKVFSDISIAVSKGGDELDKFAKIAGLSSAQFTKVFKDDASEAVRLFIEGLGRAEASGADLNLVLQELGFNEARQARALRDLALSGDNLANSLKIASTAWRENTALSVEAQKRFETTASQLTLLWNRVKDLGITLGNALLPMIQSTIGVFDTLLPIVELLVKGFSALPVPIQTVVVGLGLMAAAAGPALYVFGQLALAASSLAGLFTAKGLATKLLATDIGLLTRAYTLLTTPITLTGAAAAATTGAISAKTLAVNSLTGALGLARTATLGLWATMLAHPFVAVTAAVGALVVGITKYIESAKRAELATQELGAKQDSIALAIQRSQAAGDGWFISLRNITDAEERYTKAVEYNDQWVNKNRESIQKWSAEIEKGGLSLDQLTDRTQKLALNAALTTTEMIKIGEQALALQRAGGTLSPELQNIVNHLDKLKAAANEAAENKLGSSMDGLSAKLKAADAEIARLSKTAKAELAAALKSGAFEMKELQAASGLSEAALKRFKDQLDQGAKSTKAATKEIGDLEAAYRSYLNSVGEREIENAELAMKAAEEAAEAKQRQLAEERQVMNEIEVGRMNATAAEMERIEQQEAAWREYYNWIGQRRMEDDAAAIAASKSTATKIAEAIKGTLTNDLGGIILSAITGGGNVAKSIGGALGGAVSGVVGKVATGGISKAIGSTIGGIVGSIIPGLGTILGSFAGGAIGKLIGGGPSEVELAGRQAARNFEEDIIKILNAQQKAEAGGERWKQVVIGIRDQYLAAGRTAEEAQAAVKALWDAEKQGPEAVAEIQGEINKVIKEAEAAAQARAEHMREVGREIEAEIGRIGDVAGQLPDRFKGPLEELAKQGAISRDILAGLFDEKTVPWEKMQAAAEKFGISLEGLGPKFQGARLGADAQEILEAFDLLTKSGADVGAVLEGMSDEISELVQDSIKFGTSIPENMRPLIENLMASGKLLDENGEKIENINGLSFGDPIKVGLDAIIDRLDALLTGLGIDLPEAAQAAADGFPAVSDAAQDAFDGVAAEAAKAAKQTEKSIADAVLAMEQNFGQLPPEAKRVLDDIVLKFRAGALSSEEAIALAVQEMYRHLGALPPEVSRVTGDMEAKFRSGGAGASGAIERSIGNITRFLQQVPPEAKRVTDDLRARFGSVPSAAESAARQIATIFGNLRVPSVKIPVEYAVSGSVPGLSTGGLVLPRGVQSFSQGGIVDAIAPTRFQPMASGGFAWPDTFFPRMGKDTVPIMAFPGEMVITPRQQNRLIDLIEGRAKPGGDRNVNVTYNLYGYGSDELLQYIREEAPRATARAIRLGEVPEWHGLG